jgi:protein-disulfide isomerase
MNAEAQRHRKVQLAAIAVFAVIVLVVVIAISQSGDDDMGESTGDGTSSGLFAGLPQRGALLGEADAPATMIEFADPQCPFCAEYTLEALPAVVDEFVRPGELALEFEPLTFIGPDSEEAARMVVAAGEQDLMWQFVDVLYASQGTENSGYVDEEFLREVGGQVEGLDVERALADSGTAAMTAALQDSSDLAAEFGVNSTPSFVIERDGASPEPFQPPSLDPEEFTQALGAVLDRGG